MHHKCENCSRDIPSCGRLFPVATIPQSSKSGLVWMCRECRDERKRQRFSIWA